MSRVAIEYHSTRREVYKDFCKAHPELEVDFEVWKAVIYDFNYSFRDYILETGDRIKMPWGLGSFAISKKKVKMYKEHNGKKYINLPIDWKKSKEAGKRIYNFNSHSDGYRFKWYWFLSLSRFYQSDVWIFKPSRVTSRLLAKYIQAGGFSELYKQWNRV